MTTATTKTDDSHWMALALQEARAAGGAGEVPVGAVVVRDGQVIARGRNAPIGQHDPTAHAEITALRSAGQATGNYRLDGCDLFVTLEPCAMCAGALLHARVSRVVFGARDPKTGAAGSVVDLFSHEGLNHQTQVLGGVREGECAALLQDFFRERRRRVRAEAQPLRDDALRTPDSCFVDFDCQPGASHYQSRLASLEGLRLHYLDAGNSDAAQACVCLHGPGEWGYYFRHLLPFAGQDLRVLVPDLIGFGRSDKPKRGERHALTWHFDVIEHWLQACRLEQVALIHSESAGDWARLLHGRDPARYACLIEATDDGPADEQEAATLQAAWRAPFPDRGHAAALMAFGALRDNTSGPSPQQAARIVQKLRRAMGYSAG